MLQPNSWKSNDKKRTINHQTDGSFYFMVTYHGIQHLMLSSLTISLICPNVVMRAGTRGRRS